MTEMSEKENEPDDAATHTPPGTVSTLQETKVSRGAEAWPRPGTSGSELWSQCRGPLGVTEAERSPRDS